MTGIFTEQDAESHIHSPVLGSDIVTLLGKDNLPVIDFGCGDGYYLERLRKEKPDRMLIGLDGYIPEQRWFKNIEKVDLSNKMLVYPKGHVISLEVGEHIPKECEQTFLDNIVNACIGDLVMSWAIPGQPGLGHVNCQPNEYIIEQIEKRGFIHNKDTSGYLRKGIEDNISWFRNTLMHFIKL